MADAGLVLRQTMTDIASAIRTKGGASGNLRPSQMAQAILSISGGGGGNVARYSVSVSGGYNGGAVITVQIKGTTIFTATASDTYNLTYDKVSGSQTIDGVEYTVTVTPPANSTALLGISLSSGEEERTFSVRYDGRNTSYGYNYSDEGTIIIPSGTTVPLISSAEWAAKTLAEKQSYGYVGVLNGSSGTVRGTLVYGAAYQDTGLPESDPADIICLATGNNFVSGAATWGSGSNPIQISQGSLSKNVDNSVAVNTLSDNVRAYVDLGASDTPFTAYIVAKLTASSSGYARLLSAMASRGAAQGIMLYGRTNIYVSSWRSDTGTGLAPTNWFVGVIRYGGTGQALGGVCAVGSETVTLITKAPNTCGRYVTIGRTDIDASTSNAEPSDMNVLFMGVVSEAESDAVITENMKALSQAFASQSS